MFLEEQCNIFDRADCGYIGILTNGIVKADGCLVMGAGQAKEAVELFPGIDYKIGQHVKKNGNVVGFFNYMNVMFFSFPTKDHYSEKSGTELIFRSARVLFELAKSNNETNFYLPRPGCGLGGLDWNIVKSLISFLPDNVIIVNK